MSHETIEQEIQAKGLTAPRVTLADIEASIIAETYFTAAEGGIGAYRTHNDVYQGVGAIHHDALGLLTFCVQVLRNGTKIVGINHGPVSPENFDAQTGRDEARKVAIEQIWPLMGYALRERLSATPTNASQQP